MYDLREYHVMKPNWGIIIASTFLISTLDGGEWSASRPGHFTLEEAACAHWIECWMSPRDGLDVVKQKKFSCLCRESNSSRSARCYTE
jgi:hypothetical protein